MVAGNDAPLARVTAGPDRTVIGVDIGGSKTHALCVRGEQVECEAIVTGANPSAVGMAEAGRQLKLLATQLSAAGSGFADTVCIGAAGLETPAAQDRLRDLVHRCLPGARYAQLRIVPDTRLVLAAAGLSTGLVAISGTGAAAWGCAGGSEMRAGGWGYLLGDEGSGFGVVRAALRHVLDRADLGAPVDAVTSALLHACLVATPHQLLQQFYDSPSPRDWSARARLIFALAEAEDATAERIVTEAAGCLTEAVVRVSRKLKVSGPVVLAGGVLCHQPLMQRAVRLALRSHQIEDVRQLDRDPVHGAVALALETS